MGLGLTLIPAPGRKPWSVARRSARRVSAPMFTLPRTAGWMPTLGRVGVRVRVRVRIRVEVRVRVGVRVRAGLEFRLN